MAPPITFMIDGEQYVSILAGDGGSSNFLGDNFGEWRGKLASIKYGNNGKLLTFKLGGSSKIEQIPERDLTIPEQPILNASIDDIELRAEYIRKGTRWDEIEKNIKRLQ